MDASKNAYILYIEHLTKRTMYYVFPQFNDASANLTYVMVCNSAQMDDVSVDLLMHAYMPDGKVCQNVM